MPLRCLDRSVVELVTVKLTNKVHFRSCTEAWLWTYLRACLATQLGYDEARAVVTLVREEGCRG